MVGAFDGLGLEDVRAAELAVLSGGPVLISGPRGCGKRYCAGVLHGAGRRAGRPFVIFDCEVYAGRTDVVVESALFGQVRGSHPSAFTDRTGIFDDVAGGTVYLRHVEYLSGGIQIMLASVVESGMFWRVGGGECVRMDVGIIASTECDLWNRAESGEFDSRLYGLLSSSSLSILPLCRRGRDLSELLGLFISSKCDELGVPHMVVPDDVCGIFSGYGWPGNVGELKAEADRLCMLASMGSGGISSENISPHIWRAHFLEGDVEHAVADVLPDVGAGAWSAAVSGGGDLGAVMDAIERGIISHALERNGGNRTRTAEELGISRRTLARKLGEG